MNRLILLDTDRISGNQFRLSDDRAAHIRYVLKATIGDTLRVGLLDGPIGIGTVISIDDTSVEIECEFSGGIPVIRPEIDILCAVPRPKSLKKVLFASSMMGVRRIMFVRANQTDRSYLHSPLLTPQGWTSHLLDGLAQGGGTRLPKVSVHPLFRPFVEDELPEIVVEARHGLLLLPDPLSTQSVRNCGACDQSHILVAIGPEGGWVPFEIELLTAQRFVSCQLGPWTLRVEHAVIAALAQLWLVCGDQSSKTSRVSG